MFDASLSRPIDQLSWRVVTIIYAQFFFLRRGDRPPSRETRQCLVPRHWIHLRTFSFEFKICKGDGGQSWNDIKKVLANDFGDPAARRVLYGLLRNKDARRDTFYDGFYSFLWILSSWLFRKRMEDWQCIRFFVPSSAYQVVLLCCY